MEDALLRADGATALLQQIQIDPGAEADSAAMAAALTVFKHCCTPSEQLFSVSARMFSPEANVQSESAGGWRFVQPVASS
jgi:hypothetical protein